MKICSPKGNPDGLWDCLVSNLGFWGAVGALIFVAAVIASIDAAIVASGGVIGGEAFWSAYWSALAGFGIAGAVLWVILVIVSCIVGFQPPF
jgi:hypothetical protein